MDGMTHRFVYHRHIMHVGAVDVVAQAAASQRILLSFSFFSFGVTVNAEASFKHGPMRGNPHYVCKFQCISL